MAEDHEQQDGAEEQPQTQAARPTTAAARRERRAAGRAGATGPSADKAGARPTTRAGRRAKPSEAELEAGKATLSKADQGIVTRKRGVGDKQPGILARFVRFLREVVSELRKVIWPTRKQQLTYTIVVLVFVAFVVAFVSGLDYGFTKLVFVVFG